MFAAAGFEGFRALHEHGPWMIAVVTKPA